ncbi:proton-conducting transporter transmembrane domain-containing protein [Halopenitus persicus]|uniref:proton-conducting transporter transmembrane domain-containing protein n=1 Tax=Halopenitus persicus TaxID=1048396 RepID=UPI000BBB4047|nr:proton-conducting transporter membrane subunit [Halopenitus persicus]
MSDLLLPLAIVVPILAATLPLLLGRRYDRIGWPIAAATAVSLVGIAAWIARTVFVVGAPTEYGIVHELGGWQRPYGIELVADELSAALVVLVALVAAGTLVLSRVIGPRGNAFYSGYLLLTGGLMGITLTGDLFNLFVFLEIVGLTTYALVAADRSGASAYASIKYLIVGTVGASLYLIGVGYTFLATGSLNMIDLQSAIAGVGYGDPLIRAGYAFIVVGLSLKIAVFPLHVWQPDAYQRAPDAVTAFIAALVSTSAAYALLRITYTVFTVEFLAANDAITNAMLLAAGVSILVGSALAAMQSDLKRLFAYSSVAQFGMIVAAIALANETALLGGIVHLLGHGLLKFGLFLAVALLAYGYGARRVADLASLARRAPYLSGAFVVLGLALVGIPPSVGLLGKWYIALGAVRAAGSGDPAGLGIAAVMLASTLFTLAYVARVIEQLYFAGADPGPGDAGSSASVADAPTQPNASTQSDAPAQPDGGHTGARDVPTGAFVVLVVVTLAAVGLGFAGFAAADLFEPFLGRMI